MKRFLTLTAAILAIQSVPAFAEEGGDKADKSRPSHHEGKMFEESDSNGDGTISKAEFKAHHEKKMDEWFSKLDGDGNGEINREEAKAGREKMREHMKEKMKERRESMDEKAKDSQKPKADVKEEAAPETPATDAPAAAE